jgi:hypothetical protein
MAELSAAQLRLRERFEGLVGAAAPVLDAILAIGERVSRVASPGEDDYYPIRPGPDLTLPDEAVREQPVDEPGES